MIRLHPNVLYALFLLGSGPFLGDFDHSLDGVDKEDRYESIREMFLESGSGQVCFY